MKSVVTNRSCHNSRGFRQDCQDLNLNRILTGMANTENISDYHNHFLVPSSELGSAEMTFMKVLSKVTLSR